MNDYVKLDHPEANAWLCDRCGCLVSGVRLGTHDTWHLMLGFVRTTTDDEPVQQAPVR